MEEENSSDLQINIDFACRTQSLTISSTKEAQLESQTDSGMASEGRRQPSRRKRKQEEKEEDDPGQQPYKKKKKKWIRATPGPRTRRRLAEASSPFLPDEILVQILKHLVAQEGAVPHLCRTARVCRQWWKVSMNPGLWRKIKFPLSKSFRTTQFKNMSHVLTTLSKAGQLRQVREADFSPLCLYDHKWISSKRKHWSQLRVANLNSCHGVTPGRVRSLLADCPSLTGLCLRNTSMTDLNVRELLRDLSGSQGARLTRLELSKVCPQLDSILRTLTKICPNLEELALESSSVDGFFVKAQRLYTAWPRLRSLSIMVGNSFLRLEDANTQGSGNGFPHLQELSLHGHPSRSFLQALTQNATGLRCLDLRLSSGPLSRGKPLTTEALESVPATALKQLSLSGLFVSEDESLFNFLAKHRHSLEELTLGRVHTRNDVPISPKFLALCEGEGSPQLKRLDLSMTDVDHDTLAFILQACPRLEWLNLESCRPLPRGIKRIYEGREIFDLLQRLLKT